ncbi:hypothetical protein [Calderihabitans maritimus]|uniref:Molybdopterin cofactor biosynthesis MoaD-related C-terminal domain-containing protein n=1 Tax=Calderihabitans maritimus TaxID=1246530 RepID=A0A1Z5HT06_9FIRM|nr:hypothetical protein [Calderihabitans maritimus]GAW92487.1 hypothetical protein Desmer_0202 [Calderihabitans maritimus]
MPKIEIKIESGIPRKYLIEYFTSISDSYNEQGKFWGSDWEVEVGEEQYRKFGTIKIPATQLIFRADKNRCNEIVEAFRLKFLSAGG